MNAPPSHVNELKFELDHPALAGHFPTRPLVPGVLLLDAALLAVERAQQAAASNTTTAGWHVASAKFHRPVLPGESLQLHCAPQSGAPSSRAQFRVEIHAADALVLSALIERRSP